MKFFIAFALIVAVASASPFVRPTVASDEIAQVQQIIQAIQSPSTDPATAALLEQLLLETLGVPVQGSPTRPVVGAGAHPIAVGPAIVEGVNPIAVGPAIVEGVNPIAVGPAIVEGVSPIAVGPAIVDAVEAASPVEEAIAAALPLVQIILNVNAAGAPGYNPVVVETPVVAAPVAVPEGPVAPAPVVLPEATLPIVAPQPVQVVEITPMPVHVVEAAVEPVIVANPVFPEPIAVANPVFPAPIAVAEPAFPEIVVPAPVVIGEPTLPEVIVPQPIAVAEPTLPVAPAPAIVLPEILN